MHTVMLVVATFCAIFAAVMGWFIYDVIVRLAKETLFMHKVYSDYLEGLNQQQRESVALMRVIGQHITGIRATLESVVRVDPAPRHVDLGPHLKGLSESIGILREAVVNINMTPDDLRAQLGGLSESVSLLRDSEQARRAAAPPRMTALEAPQVPRPHGEAKTLLLMNKNHTVAHEVTWHRDVPKTYAYAGRVFELLGVNESGQWEFLPC